MVKIQLPQILPGVSSGALFAFITSFDGVVVVRFLAGVEERTIPRQMWAGIREQISPTILAVATILILLLLTTVELLRRRHERLRGIRPSRRISSHGSGMAGFVLACRRIVNDSRQIEHEARRRDGQPAMIHHQDRLLARIGRAIAARPELAAPAVILPLLGLGLLLWGQWGWLIAFEALKNFCFG